MLHWHNACEFHNSVPALLSPILGWVGLVEQFEIRSVALRQKIEPLKQTYRVGVIFIADENERLIYSPKSSI